MRNRHSTTLAALVWLLPAALAAQSEDHRLTDRMIERAEVTVRQIALTRWHARESVAALDALVNSTDNARSAHRNLGRQIRSTEWQLDKLRLAVDRMQASANAFFGDWAESVETISDDDLRAQAFGHMSGTRDRYDEILALGRRARDEFAAFVPLLRDKLARVGRDLNPEGLAELRADSEQFAERAETLRREIDRTIGTADRYIDALRPQ